MPYMDHQNAQRLVDTYSDLILRISLIYLKQTCDAEDICQEVFLKLLSNDLLFEQPEHEKAWIIRTAINACKDHLRRSFFRRNVPLEEYTEQPEQPDSCQESELLDLVLRLPENCRISLILHYYEGYSVREIAELLGKRENTVSAWLSRGRKRLKKLIVEEHVELIPAGSRHSAGSHTEKGVTQHV